MQIMHLHCRHKTKNIEISINNHIIYYYFNLQYVG